MVSQPVGIRWKKGKDLTKGLTDAAVGLWEARQRAASSTAANSKEMNGKGKGKSKEAERLPEYTALAKKLEANDPSGASFFCFFGFVGARGWVSAEESEEAVREERERRERRRRGEKVEEEEGEDEEGEEEHAAVEIFAGGDEVANVIAEDLWPNAIKYFSESILICRWSSRR